MFAHRGGQHHASFYRPQVPRPRAREAANAIVVRLGGIGTEETHSRTVTWHFPSASLGDLQMSQLKDWYHGRALTTPLAGSTGRPPKPIQDEPTY
jgi:hypothetical protein